ncbi:hypothetical protein [Methylobacterium sp. WL103]|uniref:hypothetical protein n=1 Tax=Methylobacterium sp. WL103 TaxID=2603891 RepID=UPI001AED3733|nr:hypothetical protein [Methylobacterium sp. WL103]
MTRLPRDGKGCTERWGLMRTFGLALLVLSLLIGGGRLFTGVIYSSDEPVAFLVLKRVPATWIERPEADDRPLSEQIIIDKEEPSLAYGWLYLPLMRMALPFAACLAGAAVLLLAIFSREGKRC